MKCFCVAALSIVVGFVSATAHGQQGGIPQEVLRDLEYSVGDWTTRVQFGDQVTEGKWSAKWSAEGKCLILHASGVMPDQNGTGEPTHSYATGVVGWDGADKALRELMFWSNGGVYDARYYKKSPTHWEGEAKGVVDGKEFTEKVSITRHGPNEFVWRAYEYVLGGEEQPDITATFSKVPESDPARVRQELAEAFDWIMGDWEVGRTTESGGDWRVTLSYDRDLDDTVVVLRSKHSANGIERVSDCRNYWSPGDGRIKSIMFIGPEGGTLSGEVTESGDKKVVWLFTVPRSDGTAFLLELRHSLQDDGTLLYQGVRLLDDGSRQEWWNLVLTRK
jgi:hypothetical protein